MVRSMNLLWVIIVILVILLLLCIIVPIKIEANIHLKTSNTLNEEDIISKDYIKIYVLRVIKVKTIKLNKKNKTGKKRKDIKKIINYIYTFLNQYIKYNNQSKILMSKKDLKKINNSLTFDKFHLDFGINLKEPITNAYIIAIFNTLINLYIAKNDKKFNLNNTCYYTYISDRILDLKFYGIINFKLTNTIIVIIKIIINLRKVVKQNGKTTSN